MSLRGSRGEFIGAKTTWYKGLSKPKEVETRGLKKAIKWLDTLWFPSVSIEIDLKQVDIPSNFNTKSMFDVILNTCKASLINHHNFKLSFIKRQTNNIVHILVRASLFYASS